MNDSVNDAIELSIRMSETVGLTDQDLEQIAARSINIYPNMTIGAMRQAAIDINRLLTEVKRLRGEEGS
jgi:hypothetical protein